ncbi:hypothetical protein Cob_v012494 [Colletotrichum orbiculare MAFF 240422]|uniref:Uncharacterized protein n=1 Tax=Colletotrichum orbiculare (strain 104-T / ATCC 96160 / CBS 514.97 / LARS 414 / MAFF 240422) TaxID=1213857 RepID=A0A484F8Y5_COLOR|nr:hypothetical protein Cob_v012494 [Colletotrichum orbiculare MAFF 240422]
MMREVLAVAANPVCLPYVETDDQGRVIVLPGDRFCRVSPNNDAILCTRARRFSSHFRLRKHIIVKHKRQIAPARNDEDVLARY